MDVNLCVADKLMTETLSNFKAPDREAFKIK